MSKKPDFRIKVLDKSTSEKCNDAGAAWNNEDGSISIVLSPCTTLIRNKDILITLFPVNKE